MATRPSLRLSLLILAMLLLAISVGCVSSPKYAREEEPDKYYVNDVANESIALVPANRTTGSLDTFTFDSHFAVIDINTGSDFYCNMAGFIAGDKNFYRVPYVSGSRSLENPYLYPNREWSNESGEHFYYAGQPETVFLVEKTAGAYVGTYTADNVNSPHRVSIPAYSCRFTIHVIDYGEKKYLGTVSFSSNPPDEKILTGVSEHLLPDKVMGNCHDVLGWIRDRME